MPKNSGHRYQPDTSSHRSRDTAPDRLGCEVRGGERHLVRKQGSSVLECEPGHPSVLVIEREVRACRPYDGEMVIAPVADKVITCRSNA